MLTSPASGARSRRVHIGATHTALLVIVRNRVETSSGSPVVLSSSTAGGLVVWPATKHGLVKMHPREPNQNTCSLRSAEAPRHNGRTDGEALAMARILT